MNGRTHDLEAPKDAATTPLLRGDNKSSPAWKFTLGVLVCFALGALAGARLGKISVVSSSGQPLFAEGSRAPAASSKFSPLAAPSAASFDRAQQRTSMVGRAEAPSFS